jgi:hypothetical protein
MTTRKLRQASLIYIATAACSSDLTRRYHQDAVNFLGDTQRIGTHGKVLMTTEEKLHMECLNDLLHADWNVKRHDCGVAVRIGGLRVDGRNGRNVGW